MSKYTLILLITLLFAGSELNAQGLELGVVGGGNLNFVGLKSDYRIDSDVKASPKISFNLGASLKILKNKTGALLTVEYFRLNNKNLPDFKLLDPTGLLIKYYESSIVNHNLKISPVFYIKIADRLFVGGGISGNINLKSTLRFKEEIVTYKSNGIYNYYSFEEVKHDKKYKAHNFKRLSLSIPIVVGYEVNKFDFMFTFDKGITNRLNGDEGKLKEINNVLIFSVNYRFLNL